MRSSLGCCGVIAGLGAYGERERGIVHDLCAGACTKRLARSGAAVTRSNVDSCVHSCISANEAREGLGCDLDALGAIEGCTCK